MTNFRISTFFSYLILLIAIVIFIQNREKSRDESFTKSEYLSSMEEWHQNRIKNLKKSDGWLSLIGLYWLKDGENSFGSDLSNDFAYNPPCAFTPYATCPLPPKQNHLPIKIDAGEKKYEENFF